MSLETKTRILDAAERILAERGFSRTSMRAITAGAGVNLGAVNYHFRSKEALIQAVFSRRLAPINQERLALLDACESRARGKPVPLDDLLHAFLGPLMKAGGGGTQFIQIIGRMYSEPSLDLQRIFSAELGTIVRRFAIAFGRTLPNLPLEDLYWRVFFTIGAMALTLSAGNLVRFLSGGICDPSNLEDARERLARFACAGLNAPAHVQDRSKRYEKEKRFLR